MKLLGTVQKYREVDGGLWLVFRCTNKEVFNFRAPLSQERIPPDTLVTVTVQKIKRGENGMLTKDQYLVDWEKF